MRECKQPGEELFLWKSRLHFLLREKWIIQSSQIPFRVCSAFSAPHCSAWEVSALTVALSEPSDLTGVPMKKQKDFIYSFPTH